MSNEKNEIKNYVIANIYIIKHILHLIYIKLSNYI